MLHKYKNKTNLLKVFNALKVSYKNIKLNCQQRLSQNLCTFLECIFCEKRHLQKKKKKKDTKNKSQDRKSMKQNLITKKNI